MRADLTKNAIEQGSRSAQSHHQPPFSCSCRVALRAGPADHQGTAACPKLMLANQFMQYDIQFLALEFDHRSAFLANQVIVRGIAVVVVENRPRTQFDAAKEPRIHQLRQGAVNRCTANVLSSGFEVFNELFDVEMRMPRENVLEQFALLFGEPLRFRAAGQILPELVFRGL
jgi:hypothetical protein